MTFEEASDMYTVYTMNSKVKNRLEEICKEEFNITLEDFVKVYNHTKDHISPLIEEIESRL
jgi:hypothetical protein